MKAVSVILLAVSTCARAATVGYDCSFPMEASPTGLKRISEPFVLKYITDISTGKAYLMGNKGSADVSIIPNTVGISFVEVTATGNVMVTAITNSGTAVHSRNTIFGSGLVPTQYYGNCKRQ